MTEVFYFYEIERVHFFCWLEFVVKTQTSISMSTVDFRSPLYKLSPFVVNFLSDVRRLSR